MNEKKISDGITVAGQPTPEDIQNYHTQGFRTIVNLRNQGEESYVADEERLVEGAGLNYAAIPISPQTLDDISVFRFSQALASVGGQPAIVHCQGGGRAGIMTLLHLAIEGGWSLQHALEEGEKLGIAPAADSPYRAFFEDYIKRHSPAER
ncbi:MAG: hypothetical protein JWN98_2718 [Abditibacteriota bacterium]|nr:hypothetical protein [Abditibacteriota bacterium]